MKKFLRIIFLIVIILSALISVRYAIDLYRTKYTPRYLKGNEPLPGMTYHQAPCSPCGNGTNC